MIERHDHDHETAQRVVDRPSSTPDPLDAVYNGPSPAATGAGSIWMLKMGQRIHAVLYFMLFACGGVSAAGRVPAVPVGQDFVLQIGQTVLVEGAGFGITFVAVTEDSRCPVDVTCVWAGNATVELKVSMADHVDSTVILNTDLEPKAAPIGRHALRLVALAPLPRSDTRIPGSDYSATLRVDKPDTDPIADRGEPAEPAALAAAVHRRSGRG